MTGRSNESLLKSNLQRLTIIIPSLTVDDELCGVLGAARGVGGGAGVVAAVVELQVVDDQRGGVLVVRPDRHLRREMEGWAGVQYR